MRERALAFAFVDDAHRFGNVFGEALAYPFVQVGVDLLHRILALFLAAPLDELIDRFDDALDLTVRELDRTEERLLVDLIAAAFDHHYAVGGAGDDDLHAAGFVLRERRVGDERAVLVASHPDRGDGFVERNVAERERGAGRAYAEHVGVEFGVDREYGRDDLHVVAETVGEQRANRPIDLPRTEHGMFARTAFALDKTAGTFPAANIFSSKSQVSGNQSMPSRGLAEAVAAQSTTF